LHKKGEWQELNIKVDCENGEARTYLYFSKYGVKDFSSLKGYVIFAYPRVQIIHSTDSAEQSSTMSENRINQNYKTPPINKFNPNLIDRDKVIISELQFNNNDSKTATSDEYHIVGELSRWESEPFKKACVLENPVTMAWIISNYQIDRDPIRNLVANIISEDTTYTGYQSDIIIDTITTSFLSSRIDRWQFAWQIFSKEYNWLKKIIGGGFVHLNWYGFYFSGDKTASDYPHNPFLSILLYSGILGLIIYIFFIFIFLTFFLFISCYFFSRFY